MPDRLLDNFIKGKEWQWFFSGIGVAILSIIGTVLRHMKKQKVVLSLFYEDGQLTLLNAGDVAIEAYGMGFDLYDITAKPDLARRKQFFKHLQFPILPNEKKTLLQVNGEFEKSIYKFVEKDKEMFGIHYPDAAFPLTLGIEIFLSYNIIGKPVLKRQDFKMMISGYYGHGVGMGISTYHYDKLAPLHIKCKKMLIECWKLIAHPIRYVRFKSAMTLAQAKLDFDGIIRALILEQISETEAQNRIQKLPEKLSTKQKQEFEQFIKSRFPDPTVETQNESPSGSDTPLDSCAAVHTTAQGKGGSFIEGSNEDIISIRENRRELARLQKEFEGEASKYHDLTLTLFNIQNNSPIKTESSIKRITLFLCVNIMGN